MWKIPKKRKFLMQVVIDKEILSTMTSRIHGGLSDKNFSQLGLNAISEDKLKLCFKDRVMSMFCEGSSKVGKKGTVFVQAKVFADMVRELPAGDVVISCDDETNIVVTAGKRGEFYMRLPLIKDLQWEDEPEFSCAGESITLKSSRLSYLIDQVQFCINQESARNYGTVGYLHRPVDDKLRLVGTDGFRLSYCEIVLDETAMKSSFLKQNGICISKRGLSELLAMSNEGFESVTLSIADDYKTLIASVDGYRAYILLSTLNFPNYQGVVPEYKPSTLNVTCQELQSVIRRVLLTSDKNRTVKMLLKRGSLTLSSRNIGNFEGKETFDLDSYDGPSGSLSINGKFLTDIVSSTSSDAINIRFSSEDNDNPVLIVPVSEPKDCFSRHVLVPIKEGG